MPPELKLLTRQFDGVTTTPIRGRRIPLLCPNLGEFSEFSRRIGHRNAPRSIVFRRLDPVVEIGSGSEANQMDARR